MSLCVEDFVGEGLIGEKRRKMQKDLVVGDNTPSKIPASPSQSPLLSLPRPFAGDIEKNIDIVFKGK
jgi:hypothetical protein